MSSVDRRTFVRFTLGSCLALFGGCGGDSSKPAPESEATTAPTVVLNPKSIEKTFDPREKLKQKAAKEAGK
jgi:hypothetical protein